MTKEMTNKLTKNSKYLEVEDFSYDIFTVSIFYFCGMFCIDVFGGRDYEEVYGFGTGFDKDHFYGGFETAIKVALEDIRNSNAEIKIKKIAESALARACVEFHLKHHSK